MNIIDDLKLQYRIGGITLRLIVWNVAIFLLSLIFYQFKIGLFTYPNWLSLSSDPLTVLRYPWTVLSYSFLHFSFLHLLFNMMVLHFSGRLFLTYFSEKQFFGLYLLSAIFAGLVFVMSFYVVKDPSLSMVGASGAIMAILVAATTYRPLMIVRLFLFGNVKLWYITGVILLLDLMQLRVDNTGGHIAHLSGALFGFIYIKLLINGTDLSKIITTILVFFANLFKPRKSVPFKKVYRNYNSPPATVKPVSKIVMKDKTQQQIDEILDKIGRSGYESLTKEEKDFLLKAGK